MYLNIKLQHKPNTIWLELGVASGVLLIIFQNLQMIKYMDLIVLKDYHRNDAMILIKVYILILKIKLILNHLL